MDEYAWRFRPLLIFAPSDDAPDLLWQRAALGASSDGMLERDIAVIEIVGDQIETLAGPECRNAAAELRARYSTPKETFRVVLVGKDGGVKLREEKPVETNRLFSLIDSMPMRRQEIVEQSGH